MAWDIEFHPDFETEFTGLSEAVQDELLALASALSVLGPVMGRPRVDTLNGSKHANMKELRFDAGRRGLADRLCVRPQAPRILLVASDKSGVSSKMFYRKLIAIADRRYDGHLADLKKGG